MSGTPFIRKQNVILCHAYFNQSMQRYRMREETFTRLTQKQIALELWGHYEAIRNFTVLIWNKESSEYHRCEVGLEQAVNLARLSEPKSLFYLTVGGKIVKGLSE